MSYLYNFVSDIFKEFSLFLVGPFVVPEMLWVVLPLVIMIFLLTFYLTEYSTEKTSWRGALTNSVALCFVGVDLLRRIYTQTTPASVENFQNHPVLVFFIGLIVFQGVFFAYSSFRHNLPKIIFKFITSPLGIYVQMYVATVLVYTKTNPGVHTIFAIILLYLCVSQILSLFSKYIRKKIMHVEDIKV